MPETPYTPPWRFAFGENFLIPAATDSFRLSGDTGGHVKIVKAFFKPAAECPRLTWQVRSSMDRTRPALIEYVVLATAVTAIGGFLFGYDTAVINGRSRISRLTWV